MAVDYPKPLNLTRVMPARASSYYRFAKVLLPPVVVWLLGLCVLLRV